MKRLRSWKLWAIVGGVILILIVIVNLAGGSEGTPAATVPVEPQNVQQQVEQVSNQLATDDGREYMMARSCEDVMAEYNALASAGHEAGVMHVSNTYNLKTGGDPYIAVSDARAKVEECS